jgi:pimeloyl-ACP methyl ester carboxylesterase
MAYLTRSLAAVALLLAAFAVQAQVLGVIMMHGKWATPPYWHLSVSKAIEQEGWPVVELVMPWAGNRLYDASYESGLKQIADAVKELRAKGVKCVVVGGHSFGGNAAVAFAASGGDLDGVLAMAPAHAPRKLYAIGMTRDAVDRARELVASGHGDTRVSFIDPNVGQNRSLSARADVFLSFFDPEGIADIPSSAARIPRSVPLMWVVGSADPLASLGEDHAFRKAPLHPLSRYVVVAADHFNTPSAGREQIIEWLKAVAAQP